MSTTTPGNYMQRLSQCMKSNVSRYSWRPDGCLDLSQFPVLHGDIKKFMLTKKLLSKLRLNGDNNYRLGTVQVDILNLAMGVHMPRLMSKSYCSIPDIVRAILRIQEMKPGLIAILPRRVGKSTVFGKFCQVIATLYPKETHQIFAKKVDQAAIVVDFAVKLSTDAGGNVPHNVKPTQTSMKVKHKEGNSLISANTARDVKH